ncbi:MAG: hypothetical protein ABIY63_03645 [Fibrobacteria bacterium]
MVISVTRMFRTSRFRAVRPLCAFALLLAGFAPAHGAEAGSLYLDGGWRGAFLDQAHRLGTGASLALAYGANESAELELRLNYDFLPVRPDMENSHAIEIKAGELTAYFAPYRGDFRPMVGAHAGLAWMEGRGNALYWNLGMDAMALYDFQDLVQVYGSLTPSMLLGSGSGDMAGELWLRLGLGVRMRLGH